MGRPRHRTATPRRSPPGLTLIELLLAVAIAGVVVALLHSAYRTVTQTSEALRARRAAADPVAATHDRLAQDLSCVFLPEGDEACVFRLGAGDEQPEQFDRLDFCVLDPPTESPELLWSHPRRVSYRVESRHDGQHLIREARELLDADSERPASSNALLSAVASFQVQIYDGTAWRSEWPPPEPRFRPRAARVTVDASGQPGLIRAEFLIPAGITAGGAPAAPGP